jgi:multiple sugar transport system permease protein
MRYFSKYAKDILLYAVLVALTLIFIGPFFTSFSLSFQEPGNVFKWPIKLLPDEITLQNYKDIWTVVPFPRWLINSTFVAIIVTCCNLFFATIAGYAFARLQFAGKNFIFMVFLASLMVPAHVTMVPQFILLNKFHLINTYQGMFLPKLAQVFGIFLMKQFFESVPKELEEAAEIDGCSKFRILWKIIVPISKPALVALGIYTFQGNWNEFLWHLIVTTSRDMFTLPVGMAYFRHEFQVDWTILMAGVILMAIPTLTIFLMFQRYFIQGVTTTGIKE